MIELYLKDEEYPFDYIDHNRYISRAVIINNDKKVAILHVVRNDIFGNYDYYELPGGGVNNNETPEEAVVREAHEETGVSAFIVDKIGVVDDYYNLIHRHNINYYFLLGINRYGHRTLEEYEKSMIIETLWISIDEAIEKFTEMPSSGVSLLVKNRELPILLEARRIMKTLK